MPHNQARNYTEFNSNMLLVNGSTLVQHWGKKLEKEKKPVMVP